MTYRIRKEGGYVLTQCDGDQWTDLAGGSDPMWLRELMLRIKEGHDMSRFFNLLNGKGRATYKHI